MSVRKFNRGERRYDQEDICMTGWLYTITNIRTNKLYIGQTIHKEHRFDQHKRGLNGNYHENPELQKDWERYGEDAFVFEWVSEHQLDDLTQAEQDLVDHLREIGKVYNRGICVDNVMRGRKHTPEAIAKMSAWQKGRPKSEAHIQAMSECQKGKKHTEESKKKISEAQKGKTISEETKEKLRVAHTGKKMPDAAVEKTRKANVGKIVSEETKAKMKAAATKRWAKKKEANMSTN